LTDSLLRGWASCVLGFISSPVKEKGHWSGESAVKETFCSGANLVWLGSWSS